MQRRLAAFAQLPAERYPQAAKATQINDLLFADGLRFLTLPWKPQWAEGDKRLRQIEDHKLAADIERLAGPDFLAEVRRTHNEYGKALGIDTPLPDTPAVPSLQEPLLALRRALKRYALRVITTANEDDESSIQAAVQALAPIDEARPSRTKNNPTREEPPAEPS